MKKAFFAALVCLFPGLISCTKNTPVASNQDIVGCWERINFSEAANKQLNEAEPWPMPYQWFCFEPDGTLNYMMTTSDSKYTSAALRETFLSLPKEVTYTLPKKGVLITEHKSGRQTLLWIAFFTGKKYEFDGKVVEKGALVMALPNEQKKKNVYFRYLKRVQ